MLSEQIEYCSCQVGLIENNKLYTVHIGLGLLLEYNITDFSYKVLESIDKDETLGSRYVYVNNILKIDNSIYMFFEYSKKIVEYNLKTKEKRIVYDENFEGISSSITGVRKAVLYYDEIWMYPPCSDDSIYIFNIRTKKVKMIFSVGYYMKRAGYVLRDNYEIRFIHSHEHQMYFILYGTSYIVSFDMSICKVHVFELPKEYKIFNVTYDGEQYWVTFCDNYKVQKWDMIDGLKEEYWFEDLEFKKKQDSISYVFKRKNIMFIIPTFSAEIFIYDTSNQKIVRIFEDMERIHPIMHRSLFQGIVLQGNVCFLLPFSVDKMVKLDFDKAKIETQSMKLLKDDIISVFVNDCKFLRYVKEVSVFDLKEFLHILKKEDSFSSFQDKKSKEKRIYLKIKELKNEDL